jgi:NAD dependent epimerase/dehydratase family enzyme
LYKDVDKMEKILVTGGAGFIGSHLCETLLCMGYEVFCMDRLLSNKRENINRLFGYKNFYTIEQDICLPFSLKVDAIYNLASPSPLCFLSLFHTLNRPIKHAAQCQQYFLSRYQ